MRGRIEHLRWLLFDRRDDPDWEPVSFTTALMLSYPRLWKIGVRKLDCGCSRRWWTGQFVLYAWRCPIHFPESIPADHVTLVGGERLSHVHSEAVCDGAPCCIHDPSDHHMADWPQHFRQDRYLMERICPHGVGHPDPDDPSPDRLHGCDGCCVSA